MADRTVEVGLPCPQCGGRGEVFYTWSKDGPDPCIHCDGTRTVMRQYPLAPTSLAALQIALAEAVIEWDEAQDVYDQHDAAWGPPQGIRDRHNAARGAYVAALAAVRQHPDYRGGNQGKGVGE